MTQEYVAGQMEQSNRHPTSIDLSSEGGSQKLSSTRLWWAVIIAGVALKLFLTSSDGIIPIKYDSRNYAQSAGHLFSNDALAIMPSHRPGLPIIAAIVAQLGIPYKLYLEFLLCFNAAIAGILVSQLMRSFCAGASLFLVLTFNPWLIANSQMFMTEPLVGVLMLMQLVFGAQMIVRPVSEWATWRVVFAGSASLLHVMTRNETAIVLLFWVAVALVVLIRQRKTIFKTEFFKSVVNIKIALLVVPLSMTFIGTSAIKYHNQEKFGVRAQCITEGEGFVNLMEALYSIPPEEKKRYAPVTRQSMTLACKHSPTLAKYQERLLDTKLSAYGFAKRSLGLENEFGTWLNWHLFNCITGTNEQIDQEMLKAAAEIRQAQERHELAKRTTKYPISPYVDLWIGDVWGYFVEALRFSLYEQVTDLSAHLNNKSKSAFDVSLYDEALLRRNGLTSNPGLAIAGMRSGAPSNATEAVVCDEKGELIASAFVEFIETEQGNFFNCVLDEIEFPDSQGRIFVYLKRDTEAGEVSTNRAELIFQRFQYFKFEFAPAEKDSATSLPPEQWSLQSYRNLSRGNFKKKAKQKLVDNYHWSLVGCWGIAFLSGLFVSVSRIQFFDVAWVATAAIVFVIVRCLMYSLVHAWLLWGLYRYVEPNNLIFIVGISCLSFVVGSFVRTTIFRKNGASESPARSAA